MRLETGAAWPPDPDRIDKYDRFEQLYNGDHREAFKEAIAAKLYNKGADGLTYLVFAYPEIIVNILADLLVGAPPVISYEEKLFSDALAAVSKRSRLNCVLMELVQESGFRGDALFLVRRGPEGAVIESRPAYTYFPELHPDNCREVVSESLAWVRKWGEKEVVRVDRYLKSRIIREAYELNGGELGRQLDPADVMEMTGAESVVQPTGVLDRNTLVHMPNVRRGNSYFGRSDYDNGLVTLFEEANERASQISRILDKHADPKIAGSKLHVDPNGQAKQLGYYETEDGQIPQYLVWNAQLPAAFDHLDRIENAIYATSRVSKALAVVASGGSFDSYRATRMQLIPTLAKRNRKQIYADPALKEAIRLALAIELQMPFAAVPEPNVRWRDGLPKDTSQDSTTEATRISSKTTSLRSAIQRLDDCSEETAKAELRRIAEEQAEFGNQPLPQNEPPEEEPDDSEEPEEGSEEDA